MLVTARYLVVNGGYCSLLVVTARYHSLLLVTTFSMNVVFGLNPLYQCVIVKNMQSCFIFNLHIKQGLLSNFSKHSLLFQRLSYWIKQHLNSYTVIAYEALNIFPPLPPTNVFKKNEWKILQIILIKSLFSIEV